MNAENIFFNDAKRLRSGWRFLVFQLLFIFFGTFFELGAGFLRGVNQDFEERFFLPFVVPKIILLVLAVLCAWLCGRFLEGLPFRALGASLTKNWAKDLFSGLALGAVSCLLAVLIACIFGGMRLEFNHAASGAAIFETLGISFLIFFIGSAAEEAYFRGYILQTFARADLAWLAIAFTAVFFSYGHFNNPNVSFFAKLNTAIAGVWFGVAYLKTRNLWFPFGIHFAWNWLQGAILGIPVSGITELTPAPLFLEPEKGADFFTGGNYGIEGGLACTIAIIFSIVLIYFAPFLKPTEEMLTLTSEEKLNQVKTEN
jgi:membrane protease YdiL (CAAX protease family)